MTAERVSQLHAAGLSARVWVPNNQTAWRALRDVGVDAIMTNNVSAYLQWAATECSGETPPTDQTAPSVSQSSVPEGADVTANVQVTGTASDDLRLDAVALLVDDKVAASTTASDTDGAVSFSWNSGTVANGTHTCGSAHATQPGTSACPTP